MVKTDVKVSREKCNIGGNVFALISTAFLALERAGYEILANEIRAKIEENQKAN
jgi:hypothetical protein